MQTRKSALDDDFFSNLYTTEKFSQRRRKKDKGKINRILIIGGLSLISLTVLTGTFLYQVVTNPNLEEQEPEINAAIAQENQLRQQWNEAAFKVNAEAFLGADNFSLEQINSTDAHGNLIIPDYGYLQILTLSQASNLRNKIDRELKSKNGECNVSGFDQEACSLQIEIREIDNLEAKAIALKSSASDIESINSGNGYILMKVEGENAKFVKSISPEELLVLTTFNKAALDQASTPVSINPPTIDPLFLNEIRKSYTEAKLYTLSQQGRTDIVQRIKEIQQSEIQQGEGG